MKMTPEQEREWNEWLDERPPMIRAAAEKFPPWHLYKLTPTGQLARIMSYAEPAAVDAKVTVTIHAWYDWHPPGLPGLNVFGVDPEDLEIVETPE